MSAERLIRDIHDLAPEELAAEFAAVRKSTPAEIVQRQQLANRERAEAAASRLRGAPEGTQ